MSPEGREYHIPQDSKISHSTRVLVAFWARFTRSIIPNKKLCTSTDSKHGYYDDKFQSYRRSRQWGAPPYQSKCGREHFGHQWSTGLQEPSVRWDRRRVGDPRGELPDRASPDAGARHDAHRCRPVLAH